MSVEIQRQYKANFILDTRGYDESVETIFEKLKEAIKKVGGEPGEVENLGVREFARVTDRHHTQDTFVQIDYTGPGTSPEELQDELHLDKTVKRLMVERLD